MPSPPRPYSLEPRSTARPQLLPGKFALLMALYEDNHRKLRRLFPHLRQLTGTVVSQLAGSPELFLQAVAQERHTSVLLLTHRFQRGPAPAYEPAAYVRVYHDAQQAEVTHFRVGSELRALFAPEQQRDQLAQRRMRLNSFFSKWLDFLELAGHGPESFVCAAQRIDLQHAIENKVLTAQA